MTKALAWIRKSKGAEDDVGLQQQREDVPALARELADEVEKLDLGVHTGFTIHSRDADEPRLDANGRVQQAVEDLRAGTYDYLVGWDDTRVCRDEYIYAIERAAKLGGCELRFVGDVARDDLTYGVRRTVEREVKKEEIEKSKRGWKRWAAESEWQGPPPKGLQYAEDGQSLEPDEEYDTVMSVFDLLDERTYEEIEAETGIPTSTITKVKNRGREFYSQFKAEA